MSLSISPLNQECYLFFLSQSSELTNTTKSVMISGTQFNCPVHWPLKLHTVVFKIMHHECRGSLRAKLTNTGG